MVATTGDPAEPVIMHTSQIRGAELTSSYYEEKAALLPALDGTRVSCPTDRISICSDSQSLLKANRSGARDTQFIRQRLDNRKGPPSSSGFRVIRVYISGNGAADELTKAAAAATDTPPRPISFVTAKALTRCTNRPAGPERPWCTKLLVQVRLKSALTMHRLLERRWDVEVIKVSKNVAT